MKQLSPVKSMMLVLSFSGILLTACGNNEAANAENKDTIPASVEPKPDNATVRPDTMSTQLPQDSAAKEKM